MPVKSQFPPVHLPETDIFSFLFKRTDRQYPDDQIIYQDAVTNKSYTYSTVKSMAEDFGKGLKFLLDWKKGDVLAMFAPNSIDTPAITWGTLWAGGVVSPANPGYTTAELTYQLKDSGARAIVTIRPVLDTVKAACAEAGISEDCIFLLGEDRDPINRFKHWSSVRVTSGTSRYRPAKISSPKTDLAFLVYSSGTTGRPKGVKLTHYNLTSNIAQLQTGEQGNLTWNGSHTSPGIPLQRGRPDKILACLPFFHIYGLTALIHNPLYSGVTSIVLSKFDIETFCSLIQQHKITYSYIVPPMVLLLSKHPCVTQYDLSSIRMTNSGAAPLTEDLVRSVYKRTGIRVKQGYGLSETSPTAFQQRWEDWDAKIGSTGWLFPNMEAKFCAVPLAEGESDGSKEVPVGETGELYLRGPNVFIGYHNNNVATRECLSEDGWFRTGDVGYLDAEGNLFITDRVKELIKYKGFQVPPAELEGYLVDHPLVDDVAVIGVESKYLGTECPRAYVVPTGGMDKAATEENAREIISWLDGRVANHKKLRGGVAFVESVPKSASGKILRRVLKEQAKREIEEIDREIEGLEREKRKVGAKL
jgi:4-coumarate--CoA ligase